MKYHLKGLESVLLVWLVTFCYFTVSSWSNFGQFVLSSVKSEEDLKLLQKIITTILNRVSEEPATATLKKRVNHFYNSY